MKALISRELDEWLFRNGFDIDNLEKPGNNGDTALMTATRMGELEIVRSLLQANANINARNNDGNNALWFACCRDHIKILHVLLEAGIDLDNQNDNGATALMYCASAGKTTTLQILLAAGANPQLKNLDDFRAIDVAANPEILEILKRVTV